MDIGNFRRSWCREIVDVTDHQLAILGILIGTFALWKIYYAEARFKHPRFAFAISVLAAILVVIAGAFVAGSV